MATFSFACGCCRGSDTPGCCACEASPISWTFTLAGLSDGSGLEGCAVDCADFNQTWTLTISDTQIPPPGTCIWDSGTELPYCFDDPPTFSLGCDSTGYTLT